jgi:hypothetical protein
MALQHHPRIVTNGLLCFWDAANTRSYPGTGTTWYDLSSYNRHITLYNTPTFSSNAKGYIDFDAASSEYGTFTSPANLSNFTCEAWFMVNTLPASNTVQAIVTQTFPGVNTRINYSLGFNGSNGTGAYDGKINGGFWNGTWRLTAGFTPTVGVWYHTAVTYDGSTIIQYQNGTSHSTLNYSATPTGSGSSSYIMRRWDDPNFLDGNLAQLRIYDRALTPQEVLQNYNATKRRYI